MFLIVKYADGKELLVEGFGPETIIGAVRDTILQAGDEGKAYESITIKKSISELNA